MRSAPVHRRFSAFCSETGPNEIEALIASSMEESEPGVVTDCESDNEETDDQSQATQEERDLGDTAGQEMADEETENRRHPDLPNSVFDIQEPPPPGEKWDIPREDEEVQGNNPQAELLAWHYRLGHLPFERIRKLAGRGDLPARLAKCKAPKCAACLFGRPTRRAWQSKLPKNARTRLPAITAPGAVVSIDQMISLTPGLIAQMRGFLTRKRYTTVTVFVDHFSGLSYAHLQQSTTAFETVLAKRAFERYASTFRVKVKHYHADNGIFAEAEFAKAVEDDGQTISYCGVNAHHQNGKAEKKIRDLQDLARTMILHAQQRWPTAVTVNLWPYAVRMANETMNTTPSIQEGVSPMELFAQVAIAPRVKHAHTFGSPVYVLDSALQTAGKRIPKWNRRARVGIYLGTSPRHSRRVALILSLRTGHVSPQFHVIFDDMFETLRPSAGNVLPESKWQEATGFKPPTQMAHSRNHKRDQEGEGNIPANDRQNKDWVISAKQVNNVRSNDPAGQESDTQNSLPTDDDMQDDVYEEDLSTGAGHHEQGDQGVSGDGTPLPAGTNDRQQPPSVDVPITTRSGRASKPTARWQESQQQQREKLVALHVSWEVYHDGGYQIAEELEDPIAFVASANPDIMYSDQAMREPDSAQFEKAMLDEVKAHTDNKHWVVRKRTDLPKNTKVLPAVWAMRRKRRITTGLPYKWKARLNLHGGKQERGVNYWETYAPVIAWTTIRLFLILAYLNKWATRQVDFVLAYPQADIECTMYMEIPKGFEFKGSRTTHCLELKKNLYGQKQAGRVWNQYLHNGMLARGFVQSKVDMCLYYRGKVAMLIYTDDGILIGPTSKHIDEAIAILQAPITKKGEKFRAFKMTDEGDLADYLGVKIEYLKGGAIKLSQPHLIQTILNELGYNERTKSKPTPAASSVKLNRDIHGKSYEETWSYRRLIGMLNFVEKSTRPEIAYAVHQAARFSNDPKESHANAVKRIGKYLLGTKEKGIILQPNDHSFGCWVDADFVGNWDRVNADIDPSTAKSRTGYIVTYGGCPLVWASKLQTEVALSTTEAEYNAMSASLREVIHLMQLVDEAKKLKWTTFVGTSVVHCKVIEDNSGALEMARLPKMRPRTKHLCVRLHHFREYVRKGLISIMHVVSADQLADFFTKPQPEVLFTTQWETLMSWNSEHVTEADLIDRR